MTASSPRRQLHRASFALLLTGWFLLTGCGDHKGRSLEAWLADLGNFDKDKRTQAAEAIRAIGTNALPRLVKMLEPQSTADVASRRQAVKAFEILGTTAAPAVPDLEKLLSNPPVSRDASAALAAIGPPALNALTGGLANADAAVRTSAAVGLTALGEQARPAVNALIEATKDESKDVRSAVLVALGAVNGDPEVVVPALIASLSQPEQELRIAAMLSLAKYGPAAKPAVPELLKAARSKSEYLRDTARGVLPMIDPEAAAEFAKP